MAPTWGRTRSRADGTITVALDSELLELLRVQKELSETQLLRVNFSIALILVHEIGHAVWRSLSRTNYTYEPYYGDQIVAEVGHAWGCWAFGGLIEPLRMHSNEKNRTCIGGLRVTMPPSPWTQVLRTQILQMRGWSASRPPQPILGESQNSAPCWYLATEYIQRVQTDEFWENDVKAYGVRALHVPPTDGLQDSQLSLNSNWTAKAVIRRGSNDEFKIESWLLRTPVESKKGNFEGQLKNLKIA